MFGLKKKPIGFALEERRVRFDGFALGGKKTAGSLIAAKSKNCDCGKGYLVAGLGVQEYMLGGENVPLQGHLPTPDRFFTLLKKTSNGYKEKLGYLSSDGRATVYDENTTAWVQVYAFGGRMRSLLAFDGNGNAQNVFIGEKGLFFCSFDGEVTATAIDKASRAACFFEGRLFYAQKPCTICYSAPYAAENFDEDIHEGGWLKAPSDKGAIVALVPMGDSVYIFYEYGLARLKSAGSAREFTFQNIGYNGGKIFEDSVGVCAVGGEKAFFLATDGVYEFDGVRVKRVCQELTVSPKTTGQVCDYAVFEGTYFLTFTDTNRERVGLAVDAESGKGYFSFAPVASSECFGKAFCHYNQRVCVFAKDGDLLSDEKRIFIASGIGFGGSGAVRLKTLALEGDGALFVAVNGGKRTERFEDEFVNGRMELKSSLQGKSFSVEIGLGAGASVRALTAEAQAIKGIK